MKEELDNKLCNDFPNLYADRDAPITATCMCWGFPGDGWFDIIYDLSKKLEAMILELNEEERQYYKAAQVKEKFGTLRYYMTAETNEMTKVINEAERLSAKTCEYCGKSGKLRQGGWLKTLCDDCNKNRYSKLK